jgi:hypothetical protein
MSSTVSSPAEDTIPPVINRHFAVGCIGGLLVLAAAVAGKSLWFLNFVHVLAGLLWTGIDLFMGFVIGPILRQVPVHARRPFIFRLMPKMLFLMPTLAIITGTSGYTLAGRIGYLDLPYPTFGWVVGALTILGFLTVQGVGFLLPINLRIYWELRKPDPDGAWIGRWMRIFYRGVALQGVLQIAIIVIMARFVSGL